MAVVEIANKTPEVLDVVLVDEETELQQLVDKLLADFPSVTSKGFDLTKIKGNARQAKAIVLHLTLCNWTVAEIAEAIQVPVVTVSRQLAEAIGEAVPFDDVEDLRHLELLRLKEVAKDVEEQWLRSCEDEVTITEKETKEGTFTETKTKPQSGNPAYKRLLVEISKLRSDLLGLKKPTRHEIDKTTRSMVITEIVISSPEDAIAARNAGLIK